MAQAVLEMFPEGKVAIGPPIEDGFYYDFDLPRSLTPDDLKDIEKRMKRIIKQNHPFEYREVSASEARELYKDQPYKLELIAGLEVGGVDEYGEKIDDDVVISTYQHDKFEDLCRGPHVESTGKINPKAVKLLSVAGAYWRGDENQPMLQRIYGTAWETPEQLQDYLHRLEEARKRDHRRLGKDLDLFVISPLVGAGLALFKPKGAIVRQLLIDFLMQAQMARGYMPVSTPHIGRLELYKTSGHYPYYKDTQYAPIDIDDEQFLLKPMNCPHHIEIYKSDMHSYRDLPLRMAEFGTVYRYEKAGELAGLTRVRGFTQDDAHLFVTPDQLEKEFIGVVQLIQYIYESLGLDDYRARVGVNDDSSDKWIGDPAVWEQSAQAIINAVEKVGIPYTVEEGEAAFYGPKLDFIFRDALKRDWQISTVQVDENLPSRFELEYIGADNQPHQPIMIHRALYGSLERFMGILIEHYAGAFPVWLAPVQAALIPIADRHQDYAFQVARQLKDAGMRVEVDDSSNRMNAKIRQAQKQKIPYMLVIGDREQEAEAVAVRLRSEEDLGAKPVAEFLQMAKAVIDSKSMALVPEQA
jgi:threonyl-tRNA synthetase